MKLGQIALGRVALAVALAIAAGPAAALGLGQIALGLYLGTVVVRRPEPSVKAAVDPDAARKTYVPS